MRRFQRWGTVTAALALATATVASGQERGSIIGSVRDSAGGWVSGVEVTIAGAAARAHTDEAGAFRLNRVSAGDAELHFRRLGYAPQTVSVRVAGNKQATVEVRLVPLPYSLTPISVRERREVYDSRLAGFHARRQRGVGYFFTREQLDTRSYKLADVLRGIPGLRIRPIPGAGRTVGMRGNCPGLIVIDGHPATAGAFDIDMLDLASFEAIEVYSSSSTVPPELSAGRGTLSCGLVALWSRPARPRNLSRGSSTTGGSVTAMLESGAVYAAGAVDQEAELVGGVTPLYPEPLWKQGIAGRVLLEFVVSERGEVELGTVAAVASTDPAFTAAARAVLPEARFRPAVSKGQPVRQAVQLPVDFEPAERPAIP